MSNFAIDHGTIKSILVNAYASLLKRRDDVIAACANVPEHLQTENDFNNAQHIVEELKEAKNAARTARLSNQSPFKDASATVQEFFHDIEGPLQSALKTVLDRLTEAAHSRRPNLPKESMKPAPVVGIGAGSPIVTSSHLAAVLGPEIKLVWSVEGVDRATLNLEILRDFLTDACLLGACRKHLAAKGPNQIAGVVYKETAQPT
jgi:hypothetical protein